MSQNQDLWRKKVGLFRQKFGAREDVFGVKHYFKRPAKDEAGNITAWEERGIYIPQCQNYGDQQLCLISQNRGSCADCSNKVYSKLTDEWVWKHISGKNELVLYMLQETGIKFGAVDFDELDPFRDALLCKQYFLKLGIKSYVARSSKKGYHLYTFFSEMVPAHLYTSFVRKVFLDLKIYDRAMESANHYVPEVFPKQVSFGPSSLGNGIKPPMVETKFSDGFNCWVEDDAKPIAVEKQWQYLEQTEDTSLAQLERAIADWNIEVIKAPVRRGASAARAATNGKRPEGTEKWEAPTTGDFNRVVSKCAALRQFWEKDADGNFLFEKGANHNGVPHMARVASLAIALRTKNGLEAIRGRWKSERTETEIKYGINTNQHPWTCKALQDQGLCRIGQHPLHKDHCFQKKQPEERINGVWVKQDLPESEWPEPSPVRFGTERKSPDELIAELKLICESSEPEETKEQKKQAVIKVAKTLPSAGWTVVSNYITKNKLISKRDLNEYEKVVKKEINEEKLQEERKQYPSYRVKDRTYFERDGGYWLLKINQRGDRIEELLTNFVVKIDLEIELLGLVDELENSYKQSIRERFVYGRIIVNNQEHFFETKADVWLKNADSLFGFLIQQAGLSLQFERLDSEHVRLCVQYFGGLAAVRKKRLSEIGRLIRNDKDIYFMPSTVITKDGFQENSDYEVKLSDGFGRQFDFKILGDDEFKKIARHILQDYFNCNTRLGAMTAFGHAMAATIMHLIPLDRSPILWLMGVHSSGKSYIAQATQCFFGDFKTFLSVNSTDNGMLYRACASKNVLLLIDDYKRSLMSENNYRTFLRFLQQSYDRTSKQRQNRDGSPKDEVVKSQGLLMITGEEPTENEASAASRMLLVDCDSKQDRVLGERVKEQKHLYCGFTPVFIHYVYNLEPALIKHIFKGYVDQFDKPVKDTHENTLRISQSLAFNMTAFRLAMEMLVAKGVLTEEMKDSYVRDHVKNLEIIRMTTLSHVSSQRSSDVFLSALRELLEDTAHYYIENLPEDKDRHTEHRNAKPLGFCRDSDPDIIFIHPATAYGEVKAFLQKGGNYPQSKPNVARQLVADGHIPQGWFDPSSKSSYTKHVQGPRKRDLMWAIKRESLGFLTRPVVVPKSAEKPKAQADQEISDLFEKAK